MKEKIIGILKTQIVSSLVFIILGICLVIMPVTMVNIICKVIFGLLLICTGAYHIFVYIKANRNPNLLDLFSGVLLFVLGGFLFFNPQIVVKLLPILLGTFVLIDCIWIFQGCIDMRKSSRTEWKAFTLINIIFVILSVTLAFNPFANIKNTIIFAGCVLFLKGIADIVFLIYKNKKEKRKETEHQNLQEDIPDVEGSVTQESKADEEETEKKIENQKIGDTQISVDTDKQTGQREEKETIEVDEKINKEDKILWNNEALEEWKD